VAVVLVTGFGFLRQGDLPDPMITHWDLRGTADGWGDRTWGLLFLPAVGLALALVFHFVPRIDPKRANFSQHADAWWFLANAMIIILALLHLGVVGANLGWPLGVPEMMGICLGALLIVLGNYLTRIRQNWFLGIRTPWTLSSEKSWRETHRLGGRLFVVGGMLVMGSSLVLGHLSPWAIGVGVGLPAVILLVYSYVVWSRDPAVHDGRQS
jgi:uncharacterized membrane protein